MQKFRVVVHELLSYTIEVEADSADEVDDLARDIVADGNANDAEILDREVVEIEKIVEIVEEEKGLQ